MTQSNEKFDPFAAEWASYAKNPKFSLVEKCFKLAQILEYPELDVSSYIKKLEDIGKSVQLAVSHNDNTTYRISILNEHLFAHLGFVGDSEDYYNPKNNFLNAVIDKRSGIPITLSIIYAEIGRYIGLDIRIAGFPSHVVAKCGEEMILDPYNQGRLLSIDDLREILYQNYGGEVEFAPEFLNDISPEQILIRLTRNLKNSYVQSYAYEMAMRCINMILSLEPDSAEDIRDKGILEERLLHHKNSLELLEKYLELNPNAEDADYVLELIKGVREKINR